MGLGLISWVHGFRGEGLSGFRVYRVSSLS